MNEKMLAIHMLGTLLIFVAMVLAVLKVLSEIELYMYNITEVVVMFGFCCIMLGAELKSYILQYWYHKYNKETNN